MTSLRTSLCFSSFLQGRCANFTVMNPSCCCSQAACNQKICLSDRDHFCLTQPPGSSRIVLQPSRDCFNNPRATCNPKICFETSRECLPATQMKYSKMHPQPSQKQYTLNYPQSPCPTKSIKSPSRMLPLLPPQARQSVESLCHTCPNLPASEGSKF